jgi:hypothetical protein
VADDDIRGLLGSVQDYLVRGGLDEDARYVLGPHAYEGLSKFASLANFLGPGADVKDIASESAGVMEGDPAAFVGLPAALAMMAVPGSKSGLEKVVDQVKAPTITKVSKPIIDKFTTSRGSTYELFDDATTQRNRSGVGHKDTSTGLQPVSNKTVFVDKEGLVKVGSIFQNPDIATRLNPVFDDKGNITSMAVDITEDFGRRRAGERIAEVPVTTRPAVGQYPVEILSPESPKGSRGRGVHFGSEIIDVKSNSRTSKIKQFKKGGSVVERPNNYEPKAI